MRRMINNKFKNQEEKKKKKKLEPETRVSKYINIVAFQNGDGVTDFEKELEPVVDCNAKKQYVPIAYHGCNCVYLYIHQSRTRALCVVIFFYDRVII